MKVSIRTDITPIPKRTNITYDQIKQFEVNSDAEEKLKDILRRCFFALYETLDKKYYLWDTRTETVYTITEDYKHLKDINCFSNLCANEEHVLQMINNAIDSVQIYTLEENK